MVNVGFRVRGWRRWQWDWDCAHTSTIYPFSFGTLFFFRSFSSALAPIPLWALSLPFVMILVRYSRHFNRISVGKMNVSWTEMTAIQNGDEEAGRSFAASRRGRQKKKRRKSKVRDFGMLARWSTRSIEASEARRKANRDIREEEEGGDEKVPKSNVTENRCSTLDFRPGQPTLSRCDEEEYT